MVRPQLAWLGLEQQFIGNKETRALLLDAEFRTFVQGDLSIDDYCRRLKAMADQLADLGEPVRDRTLVLNVLRGLNDRFAHLAALIQRQRPFPTFIEVRSDLRLAEITMKAKQGAPAQALAASAPRANPPPTYNAAATSGKKQTRRGGGGKKTGGPGPVFPSAPGQWAPSGPRHPTAPPGWQPAYGTFQAYGAGPPGAPHHASAQPPRAFFTGHAPLPAGPPQLAPLPGPPPPLAPLPGSLPPLHQLIKNLISVRQFTIENNCSVEFDPHGFYPLLSSVFRPLTLAVGTSSTPPPFGIDVLFGVSVKNIQCDNGREFDNSSARTFFLTHGTPATPDAVSHDPHDTAAPAGVQPQVAARSASGVDGLLQHDAASSGCGASSSATDAYELGPGTAHVPPRGVASSSNVPHAPGPGAPAHVPPPAPQPGVPSSSTPGLGAPHVPPPQHGASAASTPPSGVDARPPS
ncbi:uncharacterized protein [Miscanthus floridulus]|uniref:uncharacterized protein n=1 Tax=Miscanthus floridulus TaxID=154761 RepID=UPI00345953B4